MRSVWRMMSGPTRSSFSWYLRCSWSKIVVGHLVAVQAGQFLEIDLDAELREDVVAQVVQIPGVGMLVVGAAHVDELLDDALHDFDDALLLIVAFEQLAAHAVDGLALLVHDVVVFEEVFAGCEVLRFDGLLRAAMRLVISLDSIGTSSSMPRRSIRFCMRSPPKMRSRSSCSER